MTMVDMGKGINIPVELVNGYLNSDNKMLCLIYKKDERITKMDLRISYSDLEVLSRAVMNNSFYGCDFIIINSEGLVYETKKSNTNVKTNDSGYISINEKLVAHSHDTGYVFGTTEEELNKNYLNQIVKGELVCSPSFSVYGFSKEEAKVKTKRRIA